MRNMFKRRSRKWLLTKRDTSDETAESQSPVSPSPSRTDGSTTQRSSDVVDRGRHNASGQDKTARDEQSRGGAASPLTEPASPIGNDPAPSQPAPQAASEAPPSVPPLVPQKSNPKTAEASSKAPSIPEHLKTGFWERAYDAFHHSDPMLARQYEHMVSLHQPLAPAKTGQNEDTAPLANPASAYEFAPAGPVVRRAKTSQILDDWLKDEGTPKVEHSHGGARNISGIVRSFRNIVRPVVLETMQTSAIAWVASSFAAQALFNSQASVLSGPAGSNFVYILSRMGWYCRLQSLLPSEPQTSDELEGQTSRAFKGKSQDPQDALVDIYKAVLSYLIRLACSSHGSNPISELQVHHNFYEEIGGKERAFAATLDSWGPAVEKQLRRLVASAVHGQPTYAWDDAAPDGSQEAADDAESASSKLLGDLFDQPPDSPDFRFIPGGPKHGLETAYKWLNSTPQYTAFWDTSRTQGDPKQSLWVTGAPGAGKSMLLKAVARHMMQPSSHPQESSDGLPKFASFFCNAGKASPENAALVVQSLVAQVLKEQSALDNHQPKGLRESDSGSELARRTNFNNASAAFCAVVKDDKFLATCFIVDAIDECSVNGDEAEAEHGMNDLLHLISTTIGLSDKVRWLVSFDSAVANARLVSMVDADRPLHLNLDSYSDALRPAVLRHIGSKVEGLLHTTSRAQGDRYNQEFHDSIQQRLVDKSRVNFLWIDLACEIIRGRGSPWNALHIIGELPVHVEALYIYSKRAIDHLPMDDHIYCNKILEAMALTYRPLCISELVDMADLPPIVDPRIAIDKCSVFLQVDRDDVVSVVHQSAKVFLRNEIESPLKAHADITRLCLAQLSKALSSTDASTKLTSPERLAHYATFYWLQHLSVVLDFRADRKTIDAVTGFLERYFLQWVETLATFPGLPQVLVQMSVLEDKLRTLLASHSENYADCLGLIQDACRLLRFHLSTKSPPQVKLKNSLLFFPRLGAARDKMLKSEYPWLASAPGLQAVSDSLALEGHTDWVRSCAYSDDGRFLASCSDDSTVRIWHPQTGELQRELTAFEGWVFRVVFSRRGLLATMEDATIKVWDSATYVLLKTFRPVGLGENVATRHDSFRDIAFSVDGDRLAAAVASSVVIWDIPSWEVTKSLKCAGTVTAIRLSGNNQLATTVGEKVIVWGLKDNSVLWESKPDGGDCFGLCFSPDSRWLAAGWANGTVRIWDVTSGSGKPPFRTFSGHQQRSVSVSFSPDGKRLASGSYDGTIRLWDVFEGGDDQPGKKLLGHTQDLSAVCFSPNGRYLASSSDDATVRIWDMDTEPDNSADQSGTAGSESTLRHTQGISFVTISTDGRLIASGSLDGLICLWDGHTGDYRASIEEHSGEILWLAFSGDGRRLSSTSRANNDVVIWDTENAKLLHRLHGHFDWVRCAVFSPDLGGQLLASTSDDTSVRVWDLASAGKLGEQTVHRPKMVLLGHTDYVICASFSTDGRYLVSGGDDQTVRVWDLTLQTPDPERNASNDNKNNNNGNDNDNDNNSNDNNSNDNNSNDNNSNDNNSNDNNSNDNNSNNNNNNNNDNDEATSSTPEEDTPHRSFHHSRPNRITSVAFSSDDQQVISSSSGGAVSIWDLTVHNEEQQLIKEYPSLATGLTSIHYSPSHPDWILTEIGAQLLVEGTYSPPPAGSTRWSLSTDRDWILYGGEKRIFLPKQYRPGMRTARVQGGMMVIGCRSGHIMVFRFRED